MAVLNSKKIITIAVVIFIIVAGYFAYSYFLSEDKLVVNKNTEDGILAENNEDEDNINKPVNSSVSPVMTREESLAKFEKLSNVSNLSELNGKDIYDLILILEQVKLNLDLFGNRKFIELEDFSKEITYTDQEKGNINPFKVIESRNKNFNLSTTTPTR